MAKPTYNDARLMIQIAQWGSMSNVNEAVNWLWSDEFESNYAKFLKKYPRGSEGYLKANRICGYFETIGTLYKHGLFNKELLFDWIAVDMIWDRIKGFALGQRKEAGDPSILENFEAMARDSKG